jgi:type IV pilus assembly protein PilC
MTTFRYQGYDASGVKTKGEIQANSREEVERRLSLQNITPTAILLGKSGKLTERSTKDRRAKARGKVSDAERAGILRDLSTMVNAGVPFVEALEAVAVAKQKPAIERPLERIRATIVEGGSISAAMRAAGDLFPPLVADVINVAEKGGRLDGALDNAASYLERSADLRRKISNAAMYPIVMLSVSGIMMVVIVVFVLPRFGDLFTKMKADLPVTTKAMLALGKFVHVQPLLSLGITVGFAFFVAFLLRQTVVKQMLGRLALKTPGVGELLVRLGLARALRVIATLLSSNVPIMVALEHGAKVSGVPTISLALMDASETVRGGGVLSDALRRSRYVPASVTQMVIVGEKTGRLGSLLASCAEKMEYESDSRLKSLVSVIEPIMILFMGVLVGGITISIITPIYSAVGNIR